MKPKLNEIGFVYDDHPESPIPITEIRFNGKTISIKELVHAAETMRVELEKQGIKVDFIKKQK